MMFFKKLSKPDPKNCWHYECENGHKWLDKQSPRGTWGEMYGNPRTRCPKCKSDINHSECYENGKPSYGAMHVDWKGVKE